MKWVKFAFVSQPGHKKAIELLIEKGTNVNAVENRDGMTPLHYIAMVDSSSQSHKDWSEDDQISNFILSIAQIRWYT